jgi:RNA polymerase sigma factor (sigma-70 family)
MVANLRLVLAIANRCGPSAEELPDCVQEGVLGLMRAVTKFDHTRGNRFSTYAYWWIRDAVLRAKRRRRSLCHVSQTMEAKLCRIRRARAALWQITGRPPSLRLTAEAAGMSERNTEALERVRRPVVSLDQPRSKADSRELADAIPDHRQEHPARRLDRELLHERLDAILRELDAREKQVVCLRFGLRGGEPLSLRDIGRIMRLSRERIRQIEEDGLRKLRQPRRAARLVEFLDEPAPALMAAAAALRACACDALLKQQQARQLRWQRGALSTQEKSTCQIMEPSPDAA